MDWIRDATHHQNDFEMRDKPQVCCMHGFPFKKVLSSKLFSKVFQSQVSKSSITILVVFALDDKDHSLDDFTKVFVLTGFIS